MVSLENKIAIITGGGTGIGRGLALALGKAGSQVVICGRRKTPLDDTIQAVWQSGGGGLVLQADVSQVDQVDHLVSTTLQEYGKVDILVNNAAINGGAPIHTHDIDSWDQILAVNLRGPFLMARAVLPHMRGRKSGHIINISSESGLEYYTGDGAYGVSKHALNTLGEYIQRENQDYGIRVDTICPGMVVTEMTEDSQGLDRSRCLYPEDIADLVIWLLTRRANIKIGRPILIQTMQNPWE